MRRRRDGASSHDRMKNGVSRASVEPQPFVAGQRRRGRGTVPSMNVWSSANRMIVRSLMNWVVASPVGSSFCSSDGTAVVGNISAR